MDMILPFVHLLVYGLILFLIEKGAFGWIRLRPNKTISKEAR